MAANKEMLTLARESRGLTQGDLARKLDCTQGYISKLEHGLQPIPDDLLPDLADALGYPEAFFLQGDRVYGYGTPCLYHRKQKTIPALVLRQLQAIANVIRLQVRNLCRGVEFEISSDFPRLDIEDFKSPESVADLARRYWALPMGPIPDLLALIEASGGMVIRVSFGTHQLDAVSVCAPGERPLFMVNADSPWDRVRFTLAHEIGHMIMHNTVGVDMEAEADQFAAEFLMPAEDIRPELDDVRLETLAILKRRWGVSMQALARRAFTLGTITRDQYRRTLPALAALATASASRTRWSLRSRRFCGR